MDGLPLTSRPQNVPDGIDDGSVGSSWSAAPAALSLLFGQALLEFPPQCSRKTEVVHFRRCGSLSHRAQLLSRTVMVAIPFSERCAFVQPSWRSSRIESYSKRVLGWSMANNLRTELVLDAVNMAIYTRRPSPGLIHHSDRGSQYTSVEFGSRLREEGLLPSMGSVADAYDNSLWSRASFPRSSGR